MTHPSGYRERNTTADRALTILEMFTEDKLTISAVEVAGVLGVARSTAYRYLETLVQSGFLTESGQGGFGLGVRVLQLARLARRSHGLSTVAVPPMRALAQERRQTVLLTKQAGDVVVCLEREEAPNQFVRLSWERGTVLGLNAGASAQVLLAWLPAERQRELVSGARLERFTAATITEPTAFLERLTQIRSDGYSVTWGEVDPDAVGVAAPIFSAPDEVVAGVSMVLTRGPRAEQLEEHVDAVRRTAQTISAQLGLQG